MTQSLYFGIYCTVPSVLYFPNQPNCWYCLLLFPHWIREKDFLKTSAIFLVFLFLIYYIGEEKKNKKLFARGGKSNNIIYLMKAFLQIYQGPVEVKRELGGKNIKKTQSGSQQSKLISFTSICMVGKERPFCLHIFNL